MVLATFVIQLSASWLLGDIALNPLLSALVVLALIVVVHVTVVQRAIRAPIRRAFMVWLISIPVSLGPSFVVSWAIRATCLEAFVIPTGGMAPTMFGLHVEKTCEECGWTYVVGTSYRSRDWPGFGEDNRDSYCENCGHENRLTDQEQLIFGDRILVDKTSQPKRWDHAVFYHSPQAQWPHERDGPDPAYVKRLVGLPGETVAIKQGDVFINEKRLAKPPGIAEELWFFFHDTKRAAEYPSEYALHWQPVENEHWTSGDGGAWSCEASGEASPELQFSSEILDWNSYNPDTTHLGLRPPQPVRDVRLTCQLAALSGDGRFEIVRQFEDLRVKAAISAAGKVSLVATKEPSDSGDDNKATPIELASKDGQLSTPVSSIVFAIRDGQAYAVQDREVVVSISVCKGEVFSELQHYWREPEDRLSLVAHDCKVAIDRMVLERDVYYLSAMEVGMHDSLPAVLELGDNEYFMLGDNSPSSSDSRYWGAVTEDKLIGVARWCYWPFSRCRELK